MQYLKFLFSIILLPCLLFACSNNNAANAGKDSTSNTTPNNSSGSSTNGNASFACNMGGTAISGDKIDELQLVNTAFIYPDEGKGKRLLFLLTTNKNGQDQKSDYSFKIRCPDGVGVYTKSGKNDENNKCYILLDFLRAPFTRYQEDSITVAITSITSTRLTGTFSGKLDSDSYDGNGSRKQITITDGKFDIPFSTGNMRPE